MISVLKSKIQAKGPLVCAHAHIDKSYTITQETLGIASGEHMKTKWDLWKNIKENYTPDTLYLRMKQCLNNIVKQGCKYIITFIDIDSTVGFLCLETGLKLKKEFKDKEGVTILLVSQVLEGLISNEKGMDLYLKSIPYVDILGALPSRDVGKEAEHLDFVFKQAKKHNKHVHVHADQNNDPDEKETELVAIKAKEHGLNNGEVSIVHACSLACHPDEYIREVCDMLWESKINVIICPRAMLDGDQPRHKVAPIHNSIAPLKFLIDAKVNVCLGIDNVHDLFCPFSDGNLFTELQFLLETCRFYDMEILSDIITVNGMELI